MGRNRDASIDTMVASLCAETEGVRTTDSHTLGSPVIQVPGESMVAEDVVGKAILMRGGDRGI